MVSTRREQPLSFFLAKLYDKMYVELLERFSVQKRHLIAPGHTLSEYMTKFYVTVTDDITYQVRDQIFYYMLSFALPGKVDVSS